jgi:RNA polymerase sigma-70 factor (ECF subfamily)
MTNSDADLPSVSAGSPRTESTSSRLLERLQAQDPAARERLTELYGPLVYFWCRRLGLPGGEAAEVFREVFTRVWRNVGDFRQGPGCGRFRAWLWTITRDTVRELAARPQTGEATRRHMLLVLPSLPEHYVENASDQEYDRELRFLFRRGLSFVRSEFESRTWDAFERLVVEGVPMAEVAVATGLSVNGVRQARSKVLYRLREELGDLLD